MIKNPKNNKITLVALFTSDLKELDKLMDDDEDYKEKIHKLVLKEKKEKKKW